MTPLPLRTTLTLSYAGIVALFVSALGFFVYHVFARQLDADATAELREETRGVHGYLRFPAGVPTLAYDRNDPEETAFVLDATRFYQVYDAATGRLLLQSPALEPLGVHYTAHDVDAFLEHPAIFDVRTDVRTIRFSNTLIAPSRSERYLLQVGIPLDARDAALHRLLMLFVWSLPVGLIAVIAVGRWMAAFALVPVARLARAAKDIGVEGLHRRLPVRGAHDALDAAAEAVNDMVSRVQQAVADMKQFTGAMAHELRTPLAALRADIERSLTDACSCGRRQQAAASQLEDIDKLARLIGQLLTIVRADAGEISVERKPVDLAALGAAVVETLEPVAQAKNVALIWTASDAARITGDAAWMERLLLNLLDNAIKFTPPGGTISASVARAGNDVRLAVRDNGIGIAPEDIPRVFERFYRADASRSCQSDGAGLGLALVKWIADRHGGTTDVASRRGFGSVFTVTLPTEGIRRRRAGDGRTDAGSSGCRSEHLHRQIFHADLSLLRVGRHVTPG